MITTSTNKIMPKREIKKKLIELIKEYYGDLSDTAHSKKFEIRLSSLSFDHNEAINALFTILDGWISQGKNVQKFENLFSGYIGRSNGIATNSGSSANLLALQAIKLKFAIPEGSEVIIPAATFSTVAMPIIQLGLVPVYVDVEKSSFNLDPTEVEKAITNKTKVLMPVHSLGYAAEMNHLLNISKQNDLVVLEDCCEAHGAMLGNKKVGSWGHLGTFSFYASHNMTTGEGGMIVTNDEELTEICRSLREFGRFSQNRINEDRFYNDGVLIDYDTRYVFSRLGYNFRMSDITAALGIAQLEKLDSMNARRRNNANRLQTKLKEGVDQHLEFQVCREEFYHVYLMFPVLLNEKVTFSRKYFCEHLEACGIETRPFFGGCLPDQPAFRNEVGRVVGDLTVSRNIRDNCVLVGIHPGITDSQIDYIAKVILEFFKDNI